MADFIAGIFLADDQVIVHAVPYENTDRVTFQQEGSWRQTSSGDLARDLRSAAEMIGSFVPRGSGIVATAIAMPGPIHGSGTITSPGKDIVRTTFHRRGPNWRHTSVDSEFNIACKDEGVSNLFAGKSELIVYPDAAAYALGDYYLACAMEVEAHSDSAAKQEAERKFVKNTVYAHVTVDEGVGGAIVVKRDLLPTRLHAELGHIPVRRHKTDTLKAECPAHSFEGCLESFVALPSLRKRWGEDVENDIRSWHQDDDRLKLIAFYISQLCVTLILINSPTHISFSGRVMRSQALFDLINQFTRQTLSIPGYSIRAMYPGYSEEESANLVSRRKNADAGIYGCVILAAKLATSPKIISR